MRRSIHNLPAHHTHLLHVDGMRNSTRLYQTNPLPFCTPLRPPDPEHQTATAQTHLRWRSTESNSGVGSGVGVWGVAPTGVLGPGKIKKDDEREGVTKWTGGVFLFNVCKVRCVQVGLCGARERLVESPDVVDGCVRGSG